MRDSIIIIGTSTNARHVFRFINDYKLFDVKGFAVDSKYIEENEFMGKPVYPIEELDKYAEFEKDKVFVSLLWNRLNSDRKEIYERLKKTWPMIQFANIISPKASIRGSIEGDNVWIHDDVIIQNDAVIGNDVAVMAMSLVGADTVIGDHCFLGAKSTIGGGSTVGNQTFIGINCTVFDDTKIGKKCILGACTVVKRNVPDYSLYKTSSEVEFKQYSESEIESKLEYRKNVR